MTRCFSTVSYSTRRPLDCAVIPLLLYSVRVHHCNSSVQVIRLCVPLNCLILWLLCYLSSLLQLKKTHCRN